MKRIYLFTLLLGLISLFACKDDTTPQLTLKAPTELQSLPQSDYTFTAKNASETFLINWTPANYGFQAVVSYKITLTNKDNGKSVKLGETAAAKLELTNEKMNQLLGELKVYPGQTANMSISLASSAYNGKLDNEGGNMIDLKMTSYDPKAPEWNYVYVAVGYPEWDWTTAYRLGDPEADGTYEGYVNFDADGANFAILDGKDVSKVLAQSKEVATKGFYQLSYTGEGEVSMSDTPIKWGVIGDATKGGWDSDTELEFNPETQLWTKVTRLLTGKNFKFRGNGNWDINFGVIAGHESEMGGDLIAKGENITIVAATDTVYLVTLNLTNAGKYSYSLEVTSVELSSTALYLPGSYQANGGWKPEQSDCYFIESPARDFIYSGYYYMPANTEFKFTDGPNWGSEFAIVKDEKISWNDDKSKGEFNLATSGGDNIKIEPAGYYKITVDAQKLKAIFAKTGWEVIGDATPGGWDKGTIMNYNPDTKLWSVTLNLIGGKKFKFRWDGGWTINLGGSLGALTQGGADIDSGASGTYTITLNPDAKTATMTK